MVVFAVVMAVLSIQRHRDFKSARYDVGIMTQTVYNTAHGRILEATNADGKQASRLGSHVDPILALFALPWLVWPSPVMLLVAQALIVALAAWPAYRLGRRFLGDPRAAFIMAAALLLYPPTQRAVLDGFHPVTLVLPFLLFAFLYLAFSGGATDDEDEGLEPKIMTLQTAWLVSNLTSLLGHLSFWQSMLS